MASPAATGRAAPPPPAITLEVAPDPASVVEQLTRGEVDIQVRTARAFPRNITQFQNTVRQMALLDEDTAASCFYALPRRDGDEDRTVEGPSARFAEIVASAWGHMRIGSQVLAEEERFVVARGTAWDVQQNVIIAYETRRRITNKKGRRYSDDMIGVTANAASSIAIRNAILKVVPAPLWRSIWLECKKAAVGDIQTLSRRRKEMLDYFQKMGVRADRVLAIIGAQSEADITLDKLGELRGLATAIREGDTSVDDAFPELRAGQGPVVMPQREPAAPNTPGAPVPPAQTAAPPVGTATADGSEPSASPAPAGGKTFTIAKVEDRQKKNGQVFWAVQLSDGRLACSFHRSHGAILHAAQANGTVFSDDDSVLVKRSDGWLHIEDLSRAEQGGAS